MPAPGGPDRRAEARTLALAVAQALGTVGVLTVEFFLTADGRLLVNEMAPRPHNSGHLTIEAAVVQPVRAAGPGPLRPAAGRDRPGHARRDGEPAGRPLGRRRAATGRPRCERPGVKLHLYGKRTPRPGRKMGHLTVLDPDPEIALARALGAREALRG